MYIEDAFRPYWASGLNNIQINKSVGLSNWLGNGSDYQIFNQIKLDEFEINVHDRCCFLTPISQDCNRFSSSSFESVIKSENFKVLPKSLSWILIKQYYSAFYSAHFILRTLGFALTQLDGNVISAVKRVADLYGYRNGVNTENGYYLIDYSSGSNTMLCKKMQLNRDGGSHVALWKFFGMKMKDLSTDLLQNFSTSDIQDVSVKLNELVSNLGYVGSNNYSWLSRIRNELNYKHSFGVWFPYSLPRNQVDLIQRNFFQWKANPMNIELKNLTGQELIRFSNTCHFIIGLGYQICQDMSKRCSVGKSFLTSGYKQLISVA